METTLTKLEILNETIKYYSEDITRRAVTYDGKIRKCMYNTEDNNHCAVGRCLSNDIHKLGTNFQDNNSNVYDLDLSLGLDKILQPQYRGHDLSFWSELQNLHDEEIFWDRNGLTERGENYVEQIKKEFKIK